MPSHPIRIGTRASTLARWQADFVAGRLRELGAEVELQLISTQGDRQQQGPIGALGGQGVFTREIQRALLDEEVDLAVHSLKDLPTDPTPGLALAAVPTRERSGDALVWPEESSGAQDLDALPAGAVVGTGSLRRQAQLLHARPGLQMKDIRGNVDTRLRKLDQGQYDVIVLAEAGLLRLGLEGRISSVLPRTVVLPAVGQGALGLEIRAADEATRAAVSQLNDPGSQAEVLAERSLLHALRGGCLAPIGALAVLDGDDGLLLQAAVLSRDGTQRITATERGPAAAATELGEEAARQLMALGASELIAESRG